MRLDILNNLFFLTALYQDSVIIIDGLTKVTTTTICCSPLKSLTCVIELASSRMAYLLGDWTEELDNSSLTIGLLLGRWSESPVRPKSSSFTRVKKPNPNKYRLQLAAIPLLDPAHVKEEKARLFPCPSSIIPLNAHLWTFFFLL